MVKYCSFCNRAIKEGEKWTTIVVGNVHYDCFQRYKEKKFYDELKKATKRLEELQESRQMRFPEEIGAELAHEVVKDQIASLFRDAGFMVCSEVWLLLYADMRRGIINSIKAGCKFPASKSDVVGRGNTGKIDIVGLLTSDMHKEPSLLVAVEIALLHKDLSSSLHKDILKLRANDYFDSRIIVTKSLDGSVDGIRITSVENFLSVLMESVRNEIK